jgi:hypothetical protein
MSLVSQQKDVLRLHKNRIVRTQSFPEQEIRLQPIHLLWTLHFMRAYPKLDMMCATFKVGCHKVVMKNIWLCIDTLSLLAYDEVRKRFYQQNDILYVLISS